MSSGRMKEAEMGGRGKTYKVDIETFYLAHLYRSHFKHNKSPFPAFSIGTQYTYSYLYVMYI